MLITESELRLLIRRILEGNEDEEVLGEPDLSSEDEREDDDDMDDLVDEYSAIGGGSAASGGVRGYVGTLDNRNTKKSKFI